MTCPRDCDCPTTRNGLRAHLPKRLKRALPVRASRDTTTARIVRQRRTQAARKADARLAQSAEVVLRRAEVRGRPACERCGLFADTLEMSHRKPRSAFSPRNPARDAVTNLLALCASCHRTGGFAVHREPLVARSGGWVVDRDSEPRDVPVLRRGSWVLLDDHGGVRPA